MDTKKPPSRYHVRLFRRLTVAFLTALFFLLFAYVGVHSTSSSEFCKSCHNNNPEYYTWKASSHSSVECVSCHIAPGFKGFVKAKANGVVELYKTITDNYGAPVVQANPIPDAACERCHNMDNRNVSASGDLIISHDKHKKKDIACVKCHGGVAHGKVSESGVAYKTDYSKWDEGAGKTYMKNPKLIRPEMITCMNCHEVKKAPLECEACHTTKMVPESHKKKDFLDTGKHGIMARDDLLECNFCHSYMSEVEVEDLKELPATEKFLKNDKNKVEKTKFSEVQVQKYAKTNTYCRECHSQRPKSHLSEKFSHSKLAKGNRGRCFTCHEYQIVSKEQKPVTDVACGSCHPATHKGYTYERHPISVDTTKFLQPFCSDCHKISLCKSCHDPLNKEK